MRLKLKMDLLDFKNYVLEGGDSEFVVPINMFEEIANYKRYLILL